MRKKIYLPLLLFIVMGTIRAGQEEQPVREALLEDVVQGVNGIVVTLRSIDSIDRIQIVVAPAEGLSIFLAFKKQKFQRPLTHDLFKTFLDRNGWRVEKVLIRDIVNGAFHADLILGKNGKKQTYDARSSDAIALGIRYGAKIFIKEKVLEQERRLDERRRKAFQGESEVRKL